MSGQVRVGHKPDPAQPVDTPSGGLLFIAIGGQESNFSVGFKLKTHNNLPIRICYKNVVDITLLYYCSVYSDFKFNLFLLKKKSSVAQ